MALPSPLEKPVSLGDEDGIVNKRTKEQDSTGNPNQTEKQVLDNPGLHKSSNFLHTCC